MVKLTGNYIAVKDTDLQESIELLEEMYNSFMNQDYDCIAARRMNRKRETPIRSFFAR
ncbi:hypothetical protein [Clostridium estertheticum]|uniref:hypothetical protein n=1 Tax=Clostridium estertheticum TaxID=238834 RepID=UPI00217D32D3|nr:hypothetical protein [Clostridium estertheticum]